MRWKTKPDPETIASAQSTIVWTARYRKQYLPAPVDKIKMTKKALSTSKIVLMTIDRFRKLKAANMPYYRLQSKRNSAAKAFPPNDRPRGARDLKAVEYLMSTAEAVSPILVAKIAGRFVMLDGVHRAVAANLLRQPLAVAIACLDA